MEETTSPIKRTCPDRYTQAQIDEALRIFAKNRFDYSKTCREIGVDRRSLKSWVNRSIVDRLTQQRLKELAAKEDEPIDVKRDKFEKTASDAKQFILEKIVEMVPKEKDLDRVSRALRAVHESQLLETIPPDEPGADTNILNMVTNQILQIKENSNGTKDNRVKRNSKKSP